MLTTQLEQTQLIVATVRGILGFLLSLFLAIKEVYLDFF
jgi:hypothetical protein